MGGNYTTVFDATTAGWTTWPHVLFCAIFIGVGLVVLRWPHIFKTRTGAPATGMGWFMLVFGAIITALVGHSQWGQYSQIMDAAHQGTLKTVEGKVEKFIPMPYAGHALESFCVKKTCFGYSDYLVTNGFNHTSSHGGPVHGGLQVRIAYIELGSEATGPTRNVIVKLEVAK